MVSRTARVHLMVLILAASAVGPVALAADVQPGVWLHDVFPQAKAYAEQNDLPVVFAWGKDECGFCDNFERALALPASGTWAANVRTTNGKKVVFCHVKGDKNWNDPSGNSGAAKFISSSWKYSATPVACFYWKSRGEERFSIQKDLDVYERSMTTTELQRLLGEFEGRVEKFLAGIVVGAAYATFPFGDTEHDRLEAIAGQTTFVDIPIVRTNATTTAAVCKLSCACGASPFATNLSWAAGETMKFVRYELPPNFTDLKSATLTLTDDAGAEAVRHIVGLTEVENSTKNPRWTGAAHGEWTMDIGAVTNLVAAEGGHALVLIAGGCWCPDCAMADAYLFDRPEFRAWAKDKRVALGIVDIPSDPTPVDSFPSLLRYESYRTSDSYVTFRGHAPANETLRYQSGAGYLSRNSIPYADALDVADRNRFLASHNTLNGGWNRPERSNQARPGVPILVLLRADGSIAGRWNPFASVAPTAYSDQYLCRFEEMFAQIDEPVEEANDNWSTTAESVGTEANVSATLSAADAQDVYRIAAPVNTRMVFSVTGSGDSRFTVSVLDAAGVTNVAKMTPRTLAEATGPLSDGLCVTAKVCSAACYVKVSYPVDKNGLAADEAFSATNVQSTVHRYALAASGRPSGGDIGFVDSVLEVSEGCDGRLSKTVAIRVARTNGVEKAASVRIALDRVAGTVDGRVDWVTVTNAPLTWAAGESGERTAILTVYDSKAVEGDLSLRFVLTDLRAGAEDTAIDPARASLVVNVYDDEIVGVLAYRNVSYQGSVVLTNWQEGASITVRRRTGSLPSGITVSVRDGRLVISGVPTRVITSEAVYVVKAWDAGGRFLGEQEVVLSFTVRDADFSATIPSLAETRTYRNLPVVDEDECVRGVLTLTVPASGRLSARYRSGGASFSYRSSHWDSYVPLADQVSATLAGVGAADGLEMQVALRRTGGTVTFEDPLGAGAVSVELPSSVWSRSAPADGWRGQYTVQLPQTNRVGETAFPTNLTGAGYIAMRMTNEVACSRGAMLYAGVLPNGQAVSGSSVLLADDAFTAFLPIYRSDASAAAPFVFSGALALSANAAAGEGDRWCVRAATRVVWETGGEHPVDFEVYGGYYDSSGIYTAFQSDFRGEPENFYFHADTGTLVSGRYGHGAETTPVSAEVSADNTVSLVAGDPNPQHVTLKFSLLTGVISGTLRIPFAGGGETAVTYRGIALPGWQQCGECTGFVTRPWATGSCSFADRKDGKPCRSGFEIKLDRLEEGF